MRRRWHASRPRRATPGAVLVVLVLVLSSCAGGSLEVGGPTAAPDVFAPASPADEPASEPAGTVTVGYPDEPAGFLDLRGDDPAAADLQALWGLPLFRTDADGRLEPALVARWELGEGEPWSVSLTLHPGSWSDGTPVTSADVVATLDALRAGPRAAELAPLQTVEAVAADRVTLSFDRPYARWPYLLDGVGVLPAAVLADGGLDAYDADVPVSGGWYRLDGYEPGLELRFVAHPDGPLGPPGPAELRVLVVPSYETALGLVGDGTLDGALGYLALNPVERARRVEGVQAAAPLGGTWVGLVWREDGPLGGDVAARRRAIGDAIDVSLLVEGLLGPAGEVATSPVPGVDGAFGLRRAATDAEVGEPTIVLPRWSEAVAFTARAVQRDLKVVDGDLRLVSEPSPRSVTEPRERYDGALQVRRSGPRPTLVPWVSRPEVALAADASVPGTSVFADAVEEAAAEARVWPLYRIGVAHAFAADVSGVRPSAWPGLAFGSVSRWRIAAADGGG